MPSVHRWPEPMAPMGLLASWLAALAALPLTLFTAAAGQGLGALLAGGGWIGVSVGWDRQPWALVNQPVLNFASLASAGGYWLGSWIAPLLVAVLAIPLSLRLKTLAAQLFVIQWSFIAVVVAVAWQGALDPETSHFTRWLQFRDLPIELRWVAIVLGTAVAVPFVLRLIALARIARHNLSRARRLALVALHLIPVPVVWVAVTTAIRGEVEVEASVLAGIPILVALAVAWIGYPPPLTHPVAPIRGRVFILLITSCGLIWTAFAMAGRPLPDHRVAAVQWGRAGSFNNVRAWMEPLRAPWLPSADTNPDPSR